MRNVKPLFIYILLLFINHTGIAQNSPGFSIKFKEEVSPYRVTGMFLLPGEEVEMEVILGSPAAIYSIEITEGHVEELNSGKWKYTAPETTGLHPVIIKNEADGESILINNFVMYPFDSVENHRINGYRIGPYPPPKSDIYSTPSGLIEITEYNENTFLSPHFQLKDFKCKQGSGFPKYVALNERLLYKLEIIIEQVQDQGYECNGLAVMSGYRTPYYNKAIGNVPYSRHVFGDAADIYVDENNDGLMDDLNRDGISNKEDVQVLYSIIEGLKENPWYAPFKGGLGIYDRTTVRTAFLHVDLRGTFARWEN
jgi:hypothetical protein